jgi:D-apiose dehydrogenase
MKKFAVIGAGYWATYQLAAWSEVEGARCVAICDTDRAKAESLATGRDSIAVYGDADEMMTNESLDFVDIITSPGTHREVVELAASHRLDVICQKPLAETLADAEHMVRTCDDAKIRLLVHENFRWQTPLREVSRILNEGTIGEVFRARVHFCSSFPVFVNQPFLAELDQFMLADVGTHILDVARFLFGDAKSLYGTTQRVNPAIRGEDVATVLLNMHSGATVIAEMSYASRTKDEQFPQTYLVIEGAKGSVELDKDYWVHVTTRAGTTSDQFPPHIYDWAERTHDLIHSSIVACNRNLLAGLTGCGVAETTGDDNLKTLQLVYGSYQSASDDRVVVL